MAKSSEPKGGLSVSSARRAVQSPPMKWARDGCQGLQPLVSVGGYDHSTSPAVSLPVMLNQIKSSDWKTPRRLWAATKRREWLEPLRRATPAEWEDILVGDVTYQQSRHKRL